MPCSRAISRTRCIADAQPVRDLPRRHARAPHAGRSAHGAPVRRPGMLPPGAGTSPPGRGPAALADLADHVRPRQVPLRPRRGQRLLELLIGDAVGHRVDARALPGARNGARRTQLAPRVSPRVAAVDAGRAPAAALAPPGSAPLPAPGGSRPRSPARRGARSPPPPAGPPCPAAFAPCTRAPPRPAT